jgi:hypothetical protein
MKWLILRIFIYGFILYAGLLVIVDIPYYTEEIAEPVMGIKFTLLWGLIGGITFIFSWFCLFGLFKMFKAAIKKNGIS